MLASAVVRRGSGLRLPHLRVGDVAQDPRRHGARSSGKPVELAMPNGLVSLALECDRVLSY
jgi:hypothetical protein